MVVKHFSDEEILAQHDCLAGQCLHTNATQCIEAIRPDWITLVKANQSTEFHPDWSLLEASQNSLREHMQLMGQWRDAIKRYAESDDEDLAELLELTGLLQ